jgi:hypothetical protein
LSIPRTLTALVTALVSGFVAVGCWYAGLLVDLGGGGAAGRVAWIIAAGGAVALGVAAWTWLLPGARRWALLAVPASVAVWFVVLGGLNT